MCWVAVDRAIRLANKRSLPEPLVDWITLRDEIAEDILTNFRHSEHGYFVQEKAVKIWIGNKHHHVRQRLIGIIM